MPFVDYNLGFFETDTARIRVKLIDGQFSKKKKSGKPRISALLVAEAVTEDENRQVLF